MKRKRSKWLSRHSDGRHFHVGAKAHLQPKKFAQATFPKVGGMRSQPFTISAERADRSIKRRLGKLKNLTPKDYKLLIDAGYQLEPFKDLCNKDRTDYEEMLTTARQILKEKIKGGKVAPRFVVVTYTDGISTVPKKKMMSVPDSVAFYQEARQKGWDILDCTPLEKAAPLGGKVSAKTFAGDLFMLIKTMTPEAVERVNKMLPPIGSKKERVRKWMLKRGIPFKEEDDRFAIGDADLWFVDGKYDGWGVKVQKPFGALVGEFDEE